MSDEQINVISYALFGYKDVTPKNCFEFKAYLRGVIINIRMNRILFPDWKMHLSLDHSTFYGDYKLFFEEIAEKFGVIIEVMKDDAPLCTKMLWRMLPVFKKRGNGCALYPRVLCRDLDGVATYREAQAVAQWIEEGHTIHCITDSISHNIPMLGGMIGIHSESFWDRAELHSWEDIEKDLPKYNMHKKGADQHYLNDVVYPKTCHSATEHFVKGMDWNKPEKDGRHYRIDEGYPMDLNADLKASNHTCGHIGSAGYYELELFKFLRQYDIYADEYKDIEEKYSDVFYWALR